MNEEEPIRCVICGSQVGVENGLCREHDYDKPNMTTLESVRAKVMEAVPETAYCKSPGCMGMPCTSMVHHPIQLSDVLRALPIGIHLKTMGEQVRMVAYDEEGENEGLEWWNLTLSLDDQSPEVLEFLDKILP